MKRTLALASVLAAAVLVVTAAVSRAQPEVQDAQGILDKATGQGAASPAAPSKDKPSAKLRRKVKRVPPGYGFLPGYEPPPKDRFGSPAYGPEGRPRYGWGGRYWYRGRWYYGWGGPRYYRGRWNGGGFGPCWTQTPIGPMWNCGR